MFSYSFESFFASILSFWIVLNFILTLIEERSVKSEINKSEFKLNLKIMAVNLAIKSVLKFFGVALMLTMLTVFERYQWLSLKGGRWFVLCLVLSDFVYFFKHFVHHKVKLFWNQHQVHHSSNLYSLSTGYRVPWLEGFYSFLFYIPLVLVGFPPIYIFISFLLISSYVHLLHTKQKIRLGWMNWFLQSPEEHQIHHSSASIHIDKNFGGVLNIWDKTFNTHTSVGLEKVKFGLTQNFKTKSAIKANFGIWTNDFKDIKNIKKSWLSYYLSTPESLKSLKVRQ